MINARVQQNDIITQDAREIGYMTKKGLALTSLLHQLIREYGTYDNGSFSIDVDDFDVSDKRLLLSHFQDSEWYEYACESQIKTNELFNEGKKHYQRILDDECYECYTSVMEEMRAYR